MLGINKVSEMNDQQVRQFVELMSAEKVDANRQQAFDDLRRQLAQP
jgi:hypothetical protein